MKEFVTLLAGAVISWVSAWLGARRERAHQADARVRELSERLVVAAEELARLPVNGSGTRPDPPVAPLSTEIADTVTKTRLYVTERAAGRLVELRDAAAELAAGIEARRRAPTLGEPDDEPASLRTARKRLDDATTGIIDGVQRELGLRGHWPGRR